MKPTKANTGLYTGGWLDLKPRVEDPDGVDPDPTLEKKSGFADCQFVNLVIGYSCETKPSYINISVL